LDIVLLDATKPFGNSKTLPFGILREPLENLKRAGLIVITRANLCESLPDLKSRISKLNPGCPVFTAQNKTSNLIALKDFLSSTQSTGNHRLSTDSCLAFCALGNPENFFEQLRRENFPLAAAHKFPDHHRYTANDVAKLEAEAQLSGAEILLTTAKDAVKLANLKFEMPCFVVESRLIFDDEKKLREQVGAVFNRQSQI
jgi:tetraacyldisaccharide 4'-kinase